jgi:hypothetical protein
LLINLHFSFSQLGAVSTPLKRILNASYSDEKNEPRGGYKSARDSGHATGRNRERVFEYPCKRSPTELLPNPRRVSMELHKDVSNVDNRVRTMILLQNNGMIIRTKCTMFIGDSCRHAVWPVP